MYIFLKINKRIISCKQQSITKKLHKLYLQIFQIYTWNSFDHFKNNIGVYLPVYVPIGINRGTVALCRKSYSVV